MQSMVAPNGQLSYPLHVHLMMLHIASSKQLSFDKGPTLSSLQNCNLLSCGYFILDMFICPCQAE